MSEPLFEQYKAALRRGHLAAIGGQLDDALDAYSEAARLVPERALPFASRATVLHRLDRWPEAAEAFDRALRLAPDDEATLRARAAAREERGMRSGAAEDYERLAFVLDVAGRPGDAIEAAGKAVALESTSARAALLNRLSESATRVVGPTGGGEVTEPAPEAGEAVAMDDDDALPPPPRIISPTDAEAARAAQVDDPAASWPRLDMPSPQPAIVGPPPDPDELMAEAAQLLEDSNIEGASERMLAAALVHRGAGRLDASLDICLQLLSIAPGDPHVHLAIANLQLDHGWTALAKEKLDLLLRLTALTGDTQAEADAHGLAAERLRDEPAPLTAAR